MPLFSTYNHEGRWAKQAIYQEPGVRAAEARTAEPKFELRKRHKRSDGRFLKVITGIHMLCRLSFKSAKMNGTVTGPTDVTLCFIQALVQK